MISIIFENGQEGIVMGIQTQKWDRETDKEVKYIKNIEFHIDCYFYWISGRTICIYD